MYRQMLCVGVEEREPGMKAIEAYQLGADYLESKNVDNALVAFSEAIRLDPKFAQAYNGRGVAFALKDDLEKALADFCEAIRLDGSDAEFYRSRGYIYEQLGEQDKAQADYAKADELGGSE